MNEKVLVVQFVIPAGADPERLAYYVRKELELKYDPIDVEIHQIVCIDGLGAEFGTKLC